MAWEQGEKVRWSHATWSPHEITLGMPGEVYRVSSGAKSRTSVYVLFKNGIRIAFYPVMEPDSSELLYAGEEKRGPACERYVPEGALLRWHEGDKVQWTGEHEFVKDLGVDLDVIGTVTSAKAADQIVVDFGGDLYHFTQAEDNPDGLLFNGDEDEGVVAARADAATESQDWEKGDEVVWTGIIDGSTVKKGEIGKVSNVSEAKVTAAWTSGSYWFSRDPDDPHNKLRFGGRESVGVAAERKHAEETETMATTADVVTSWREKQRVRWVATPPDPREYGEVTLRHVKDNKVFAIRIKWDIGKELDFLCNEDGDVFAAEDAKRTRVVAERVEKGDEDYVDDKPKRRGKVKDVEIVREGTQIILPPGMSFDDGILWLTRKKEADEKGIAIMEVIEAFPLEGALAFKRALDRVYGFTALLNTPGFFGEKPPVMIGVEVGLDIYGRPITEQVPWGRLSVPGIAGFFNTTITQKDGQFFFTIGGETKQKHKEKVSELAALTNRIAREESIYKGNAIRMKFPSPEEAEKASPFDFQPRFMDLRTVKEDELIFPDKVQRLVHTTLFVPIEKHKRCAAEGVPFKRGILLEGPWGTGKTLTANVTASKSVRNGITFIYLENVVDLERALRFARLYAPAVIFAEDLDQVGKDDRHDEESPLNSILNVIDGVDMKDAAVMVVLTTNYVKEIEQGLLRPGRIDAVIPVRPPDAAAAIRLVELYGRGRLAAGENLTNVGRKLEGMIPSVIREVVERSKLEAIGRLEDNEPLELKAVDLEAAADGMKTHLELLEPRLKDTRSDYEKAAAVVAEAIRFGQGHTAPVHGKNGTERAAYGEATT